MIDNEFTINVEYCTLFLIIILV